MQSKTEVLQHRVLQESNLLKCTLAILNGKTETVRARRMNFHLELEETDENESNYPVSKFFRSTVHGTSARLSLARFNGPGGVVALPINDLGSYCAELSFYRTASWWYSTNYAVSPPENSQNGQNPIGNEFSAMYILHRGKSSGT